MNKPWDNEPTPTVDAKAQKWDCDSLVFRITEMDKCARNLERRMRAAEALLLRVDFTDGEIPFEEIRAHLDEAQKEDER